MIPRDINYPLAKKGEKITSQKKLRYRTINGERRVCLVWKERGKVKERIIPRSQDNRLMNLEKNPPQTYRITNYGTSESEKQLKIGNKYASGERGTGKPILTDNPDLAYVFDNKSQAESWLINYSKLQEEQKK